MKRRILVTGGAGFIGLSITNLLISEGFHVAVVDDLSTGLRSNLHPDASFYHCDIRSEELGAIMEAEKPECVIHHAAQADVRPSLLNPAWDADINIVGSINLLEACRQNGVRKVVYASSAAVYGNPMYLPVDEEHPIQPTSPYGISKHTVEHYLRAYRDLHGIEFTVLRYANVFGLRQSQSGEGGVISIFIDRARKGLACTVFGDGEQTRDFVYVQDIANANRLAIDSGDGMILNVGLQKETSVNGLLALIGEILGTEVVIEYAPARAGEISRSVLANSKVQESLEWNPRYDLGSGLEHMLYTGTQTRSRGN